MKVPLCITSRAEELDQGLFGNVLTHTLQVLPYLHERGIFPAWELRSKHYGDPPDQMTIPGVVDLAYAPPEVPLRTVSLSEMRRRHGQILGSDWAALAHIWNSYFRVPARVLAAVEGILPEGRNLGVHYRGTDKQTASWDSNPISQTQFITLLQDFLAQRPDYDAIFVGTDEPSFLTTLRSALAMPVLDLGAVEFHMASEQAVSRREKADRAMLDCLLLSRCHTVIQTSSALPSFTKLFNPQLEVFRTAASKLFSNMPYFPVAYIPVLPVTRTESHDVLKQTMMSDWTGRPDMKRFRNTFTAIPRWPRNHTIFDLAERVRAADFTARIVTGYH